MPTEVISRPLRIERLPAPAQHYQPRHPSFYLSLHWLCVKALLSKDVEKRMENVAAACAALQILITVASNREGLFTLSHSRELHKDVLQVKESMINHIEGMNIKLDPYQNGVLGDLTCLINTLDRI